MSERPMPRPNHETAEEAGWDDAPSPSDARGIDAPASPPPAPIANEQALATEPHAIAIEPHAIEPHAMPAPRASHAPHAPQTPSAHVAPFAQPPMPPFGVPETSHSYGVPTPRRPRPILGVSLTVYGALLWSFVVAGQLTTSWMSGGPLSEGSAVASVLLATILTWILTLRRTREVAPTTSGGMVGRAVLSLFLAFVMWGASIVIAVMAGALSSHNHDVPTACLLACAGIAAAAFGPRVIHPGPRVQQSHGMRVVSVLLWLGFAIITLVAGAELVANG